MSITLTDFFDCLTYFFPEEYAVRLDERKAVVDTQAYDDGQGRAGKERNPIVVVDKKDFDRDYYCRDYRSGEYNLPYRAQESVFREAEDFRSVNRQEGCQADDVDERLYADEGENLHHVVVDAIHCDDDTRHVENAVFQHRNR